MRQNWSNGTISAIVQNKIGSPDVLRQATIPIPVSQIDVAKLAFTRKPTGR